MKTPMLLILILFPLLAMSKPPHKPRSLAPSTNDLYRVVCPTCSRVQTNHPTQLLGSHGWMQTNGIVASEHNMLFECQCGVAFVGVFKNTPKAPVMAERVADAEPPKTAPKLVVAPKAKP